MYQYVSVCISRYTPSERSGQSFEISSPCVTFDPVEALLEQYKFRTGFHEPSPLHKPENEEKLEQLSHRSINVPVVSQITCDARRMAGQVIIFVQQVQQGVLQKILTQRC